MSSVLTSLGIAGGIMLVVVVFVTIINIVVARRSDEALRAEKGAVENSSPRRAAH